MRPLIVAPVPRLYPGSIVAILGTGPSLTQADVDSLFGNCNVIAVNDAYRLAPWASALYAADSRWWRRFNGVPEFTGPKYSIMPNGHVVVQQEYRDIHILKNTGQHGLELEPNGLRTGYNSGYQAINLAVHLGASRIVLLGFDMKGDHYFGSHPDQSKPLFKQCLIAFPTLMEPLKALGISIVNCTPNSAIRCFKLAPLPQVLDEVAA